MDGDGVKKILMFSDIEGCQKFNLVGGREGAKGTFEQSGFLCKPAFYQIISEKLKNDDNLHVAFLGDYFDQGMGVYESIKGMDGLLTEFNTEDGKERVFVILGNRDVNKLRFCYELAKKDEVVGIPDGQSRWAMWNTFHDRLESKKENEVALVNHILFESMGAKIDMESNAYNSSPTAKLIGLHSFIPPGKDINDSELALKYLKVSLGIIPKDETTSDALDLLGFFQKCKIAHVFDGTHGKVLLAHGGGFDPDAFLNKAYVDSFRVKEITPQNYHSTLEQFRRKLSGQEVQTGGYNRAAANEFGNEASKKNMNRFRKAIEQVKPSVAGAIVEPSVAGAIVEPSVDEAIVEPSVDAYNKLLDDVLSEISGENPVFTWKFVLLQALGLKPDDEDARYKSLIQSCSQNGCKGPNDPLTTDPIDKITKTTKLAKILKDSGITHVSYGHQPICFPIPVIYRRTEVPDVTFISNDTSNGNRKVKEIDENTAIGTMVIFETEGGGVKTKIEPIELNGREAKVEDYRAMYDPLTLATTPSYEQEESGAYVLKYGDDEKGTGTVGFNNLTKTFDQLRYTVSPAPAGGKRRSRHRKQQRSKRGSKRGGSKKTRRNQRKHTKRGRKARK